MSHVLLVFVGILVISPGICADESSPERPDLTLVREARELLQPGDYAGALEKAHLAAELNSGMPAAWFIQGFALNRLRRSAEALTALKKARKLGLRGPTLDYEIGWAAIFTGEWDTAIKHLERYEAAEPGNGSVSTSLGLALFAQGELDRAEMRLREAIARDPDRKSSALYLLSRIEGARGDLPAARQHLEQLMVETPDSRLGRSLWGGLAAEAQNARTQRPGRKPWRVAASASGGYNDNVIALGDGLSLPTDISSEDSAFSQFALGASYDQVLSPDSSLTYGYSLNSSLYTDVDGFDLIDQYFYLRYTKRLRNGLIGTMTVSDQYTIVDTDGFRNEFAVRPALLFQVNDHAIVELAYRYTATDYLSDVAIAALDRDADTHTLSAIRYFRIPNTDVTMQIGYFHQEFNTDGANYDSNADSLQTVFESPLLWQIEGYVSYTKVFSDYDNPDLFSPTGAVRDDVIDAITVRLERPLMERVSAYARYDRTNNDSNIAVFNYDQNIWSAGLVVEF